MTANQFYKICDICDDLMDDIVGDYCPAIETLEAHGAASDPEHYVQLLAYFASDPYKRLGRERTDEYLKTVAYCKDLLTKVALS